MMPPRRARTLLLTLLIVGCGHPTATTRAPEPDRAAELAAARPVDLAPATDERAQTISFADDADPEPATQIQGPPKRPPLPRFRLFGTRDHDGPN